VSAVSGGTDAPDADHALPFQLDALGVRGRLVRLGPTLDAIIERHGYPLAVARPLAEAMVLCACLATSLKYDGIFTLQISGDGPFDCSSRPHHRRRYPRLCAVRFVEARGGAGRRQHRCARRLVPKLFGNGRLSFTVDQGRHTERYQGVVPLEGPTLADCAHTYFGSPSSCRQGSRSRPSESPGMVARTGGQQR